MIYFILNFLVNFDNIIKSKNFELKTLYAKNIICNIFKLYILYFYIEKK